MGHTNSTPNIGLPQFIGTDKPTWLGDVNGAMSAIDTKVGSIDAAVATVDAKADNAVADASGAVTTATNAVNTAGAASTTATQANNLATQALTVANNTADLCTQNIVPDVQANKTAIGTLADLQTTAKDNLVNAINEVAQGGGGGTGALTLAGTETGTTAIAIPAGANELIAVIKSASNDGFVVNIPVACLDATQRNFQTGRYNSSSSNAGCTVGATSSQVNLVNLTTGGSDVTSAATIELYYR